MMALQAENTPDEEEREDISGSYKGSGVGPQDDGDQDVIPLTPSKLRSSNFSPRSLGRRATRFFSLTGTGGSSSPLKSTIRSPGKVLASILKRSSTTTTTTTAFETQDDDDGSSSHSPSKTDSLCSSAIFGPSETDDEDETKFTSEMQEHFLCCKRGCWPEPFRIYVNPVLWGLQVGSNREMDEATIWKSIANQGSILVRVITWNLHASLPENMELVRKRLLSPDIYHIVVVRTEECQNSIATSVIRQSKKNWESMLAKAMGTSYDVLRGHTLQATHLIVFVHKALLPLIGGVRSAAIAVGIGTRTTKLGNKGGVGIAFSVGKTRCMFVNAHLAAHSEKLLEREEQFCAIDKQLRELLLENKGDNFDHIVWAGDLNFRVDMNRTIAEILLEKNMHEVLIENEQLSRILAEERTFHGYIEGPLNFHPTYKFDKGSDCYDTSPKQRVPACTDRILYQSDCMKLLCYDSVNELKSSDHRPVYATFKMNFTFRSNWQNAVRRHSLCLNQTNSEVCSVQ